MVESVNSDKVTMQQLGWVVATLMGVTAGLIIAVTLIV